MTYYKEPIACNFISYGNNVVAATKEDFREIAEEYVKKFHLYRCYETPNIIWLNEKIRAKGYGVCFMAYKKIKENI